MARVPLTLGAYMDRSTIANHQRCLNLFPRANPEGHPVPFTFYPTPGLIELATPTAGAGRGLFRASNGVLYGVVGQTVYKIAADWSHTVMGTLLTTATTPVAMCDNTLVLVIMDGSPYGYQINLYTDVFSQIVDAAFYGSDAVGFLDTFTVLNRPNTGVFYCTLALTTTFDPTYWATKIGYSDKLVTFVIAHREIWLLGEATSEIWVDSGAAAFPFELMTGAFIQYGCAAKYSACNIGDNVYWLARNEDGQNMVLKGAGYQAVAISTHAISTEFAKYSRIDDAVAYVYQQEGHKFYVLNFPTADKTWVYDETCNLWHERAFIDSDGVEHRHRMNNATFAYGYNVGQDWQTGALYRLDLDTYTDAGNTIVRRRSFPHMGNNGNRVAYTQLLADMEVGTATGTGEASVSNGGTITTESSTITVEDGSALTYGRSLQAILPPPPKVWLRWSDTRGASWSDPIYADLGGAGGYLKSIQFQRLGMARDRVFELFWSYPTKTALSGIFLEAREARS